MDRRGSDFKKIVEDYQMSADERVTIDDLAVVSGVTGRQVLTEVVNLAKYS